MALREFVKKHTELLVLERETEIAETSALVENVPLKELQRRGVCLLRLHPSKQSTGLYGRTLVTFAPSKGHSDGALPTHSISPGDIVGVSHSQKGGASSSADPSGIVSRVTPTSVTVAFDHNSIEGAVTFEHEGLYRLTKLANDITYRRLKRALSDVDAYSTGPARHLIDVLFGEAEPSPPSLPPVPSSGEHADASELRFFNEHLNQSQQEAVTFALAQRDVAVIHGPPGTGKTTTVVEIIQQAVQMKMKVLACAPSNVAVDNLVERLVAAKVRLVRLGHPARLLPAIQRHALDAILASSEGAQIVRDVRKEIDQTRTLLSKSKQGGEKRRLRAEARTLRKELKERERRAICDILRRADVVLATNTGASPTGPLGHLPRDHFDLAVVDECAQALEASCWVPLPLAPRCVLAGDHQQLPPTILSDRAARDGLAISLMERATALHGDRITRMLTTQYRMNSAIMRWSSDALYGGLLVAADAVAGHLLRDLPGVIETEDTSVPLVLLDTAGCDLPELEPEAESSSSSRGNEGEADLVAVHVERLLAAGLPAADIAVIAPYNLQVELLRLRLSGRHPDLEIKSVDGFQGREKEAVVISLVRSNSKGEVGFLSEDRRINVAVTRARRHVAVICDSDTVRHHGFLRDLVEYMETHGSVRSAFQYQSEIDASSRETPRPDFLMFRGAKPSVRLDKGAKPRQPRPKESHYEIPDGGTRTYDPAASAKKEAELIEQMGRFHEDQSRDQLVFPSSLNSHDRLVVHQMAEKHGLHHFSTGEGVDRQITVSRQPIRSGGAEPAASQEAEGKNSPAEAAADDVDFDAAITGLRTENPMDALGAVEHCVEADNTLSEDAEGNSDNHRAGETGNGESVADSNRPLEPEEVVRETSRRQNEPGNGVSVADSNRPQEPKEAVQERSQKQNYEKRRPSEESSEYHKCQFCKKKLPPGNLLLHEIHCEKLQEEKRKLQEASRTKRRPDKTKQQQHRDILERTDEGDFDGLIAAAITTDTRCNIAACRERVSLMGVLCPFCNRRYCLGHGMPEVHGCGAMARAQARKMVRREKEVRPGSGPRERKVDPDRRAHLERKLEKKKAQMEEKRTRKSTKKK